MTADATAFPRLAEVVAARMEAALSPSLLPGGGEAAYELKFLIDEPKAREVEGWARRHLALDPHADPALGDAYHIRSLYFDTPRLDVFQRSPSYRRRKFRLRRYGGEHVVFLERKTRSGDRVAKRRTAVADVEAGLLEAGAADRTWCGFWFQRSLQVRRLQPACQVSYDRTAYLGPEAGVPLRLTLDRNIRCAPASGWAWGDGRGGRPLMPSAVILELKYRTALPALFKQLVEAAGLAPGPVSKYRLAVLAWGLDVVAREVG